MSEIKKALKLFFQQPKRKLSLIIFIVLLGVMQSYGTTFGTADTKQEKLNPNYQDNVLDKDLKTFTEANIAIQDRLSDLDARQEKYKHRISYLETRVKYGKNEEKEYFMLKLLRAKLKSVVLTLEQEYLRSILEVPLKHRKDISPKKRKHEYLNKQAKAQLELINTVDTKELSKRSVVEINKLIEEVNKSLAEMTEDLK